MTLVEWVSTVKSEYRAAGFDVGELYGFPLVKMARDASIEERKRFLEFRPTLAVDVQIYSEGALCTPAGGRRV